MRYVRIACYSAIAISLSGPALAGHGNALAGGWDGTSIGGSRSLASANASAPAGASVSTPFFSLGLFAGNTFGSGGGPSGTTGGAPTPEVNATLGLILACGTVAFLRRRRPGHAKPQV